MITDQFPESAAKRYELPFEGVGSEGLYVGIDQGHGDP